VRQTCQGSDPEQWAVRTGFSRTMGMLRAAPHLHELALVARRLQHVETGLRADDDVQRRLWAVRTARETRETHKSRAGKGEIKHTHTSRPAMRQVQLAAQSTLSGQPAKTFDSTNEDAAEAAAAGTGAGAAAAADVSAACELRPI
jgi:hypothetical protein